MLDNFFNIEYKDRNKNLFDGLYIIKSEFYNNLSSIPVIKLDFKELKADNYDKIYNSFKELIRDIYSKKRYLIDILNDDEKIIFRNVKKITYAFCGEIT